jgi:hypothetical protein
MPSLFHWKVISSPENTLITLVLICPEVIREALIPLGVIPLFQIRSPVLVTESDKKMPPPCNTT